jgi:hypothetical protein
MNEEISIAGVFIPTFALACLCALTICFVASAAVRVFAVVDIKRFVWHPALFDFAIFVILTEISYAILGKLPS